MIPGCRTPLLSIWFCLPAGREELAALNEPRPLTSRDREGAISHFRLRRAAMYYCAFVCLQAAKTFQAAAAAALDRIAMLVCWMVKMA
jgi:hypothetical protein